MKLLVFADLQAHDGDERCFNQPNVSLQTFRVRQFFEDLKRIYDEHGCSGLVDLGDLTDDRSAIPVPVIDTVMAGLEPFPVSEHNFKLIGNHEQFLRDTSVDSGRMYTHIFRVVSQTAGLNIDGALYVFASYPENHEELAKELARVAKQNRATKKVLFGHFQAVGASMNSGETLSGVPREVLDLYDVVLLGHIHLPQSIGFKIHYVGSPFQQNWGEAMQEKRVAIFDTKTLLVTWVPLQGYPRYIHASLDVFKSTYKEEDEDRWKVTLNSLAETEEFFALPYSARAEAVYNYNYKESTQENEEPQPDRDWGFDASLKRWVERIPPSTVGIELANEELIEIGRQIATGN